MIAEIQSLEQTVRHRQESKDSFERFMELIAKYVGITKLTPTIVNEFVQKIISCEADKSSGPRVQQASDRGGRERLLSFAKFQLICSVLL